MKLSSLPLEIQKAVKLELREWFNLECKDRLRYWKVNGFKSPEAYRQHLASTCKVTGCDVKEVLLNVCKSLLKAGKDYTALLPENYAYKVRLAVMESNCPHF